MTKFIVDEMLGNIARWLRILGFDTLAASELREHPNEDIDTKILLIALDTGRVLVTSDMELIKRARNLGVKVIHVDNKEGETCIVLKKILTSLNAMDEARNNKMTRCPICNGLLRHASRNEAKGQVPQRVYETTNKFWVCTKCNKFYWIGSHFRNIRKVLTCVLGEDD